MSESFSTEELLAAWRAGDEAAAEQIFKRYAAGLCGLAEKEISAGCGGDSTRRTWFSPCSAHSSGGRRKASSSLTATPTCGC